jgi:predicted O-methyltransferase YrrM
MFHENWYSNEQLQNLGNLTERIINLQGNIIEIGCWEGKSTHYLANKIYPENIICNDTWLGNVEESKVTGTVHVSEIIARERNVFNIFIQNMNALTRGNYTVIKRDCLEWLNNYNEPIKFCHIDASHEYESVLRTIQLLLPHVVKGGILCGDDFLNSNIHRKELHGGVERAVRECLPNFQNIGNLWYWINE